MKIGKVILVGVVALSSMCLIAIVIHLASSDTDEHPQCKLQTAIPLTNSHQLRAFKSKNRDVLVRFSAYVEYFDEANKRTHSGNHNDATTSKRTLAPGTLIDSTVSNVTNQQQNQAINSLSNATSTHPTPLFSLTSSPESKYVALQLESVKSETHSDKNNKHDHSMLMTRIKLQTSCAKLSFDMMSKSSDNKQFAINNKIKLYRYKLDELECKLDNSVHSNELLFQAEANQHYFCPERISYNCTKLEDNKRIVATLHITHIELEWNRPEKMKGEEFITRQSKFISSIND